MDLADVPRDNFLIGEHMQDIDLINMQERASHSNLKPWIVLFVSSLFFLYEFIQGTMFASIADNIMQDFAIKAKQMTILSSMYYLSTVIFLFFAGRIFDKFSAKRTILMAMLVCISSTFVLSGTHDFYVALSCRIFTGIGSAFCFLGPIRICSTWFASKRMAFVTGIIVTIAMSGGMLAQYPLTHAVLLLGWRDALYYIAWLGVIMFTAILVFVDDAPDAKYKSRASMHHKKSEHDASLKKFAYLNFQSICAGIYTSLMNMPIAVFGAVMGSLYLMQRLGIDKEHASMINSMIFFGTIIGGPLMGALSDKLNLRLLPMRLGLVASFIVMLAILYLPVNFTVMGILFFLLGFFTSSQVISYALVAESHHGAIIATALSIVSILTQSGYIVYQNIFAWILAQQQGMQVVSDLPVYNLQAYTHAAIIIPLGFIIAFFALFKIQETYCRKLVKHDN
jgi:MFS family permease